MKRPFSQMFLTICALRFALPVFADLNGLEGLRAVPIMANESMPKPIMGVGVGHDGTVYVTETIRQQREEISLIQSPFLHPHCMALSSTEAKRKWILENYTSNVIGRQGVKDYNGDGKVDVQDLSVRSEKIYTLQDSDGDGVYDKATLFAEGFNDLLTGCAHSVAPIGDHVYATIIPDLWKLTDSDGDGRADRRESLAHGFAPHIGYGNHDLHSILQGYDGKLYWSMGDRGANVLTKEGKRVSNPHSGCILRCNPDGSEFEVFAHGLRNCQYFDFDNYGNLFSVDHDADFQGERERLVYLPEGSDSGWRMYYQYRNNTHVRAAREDLYNPWLAEKMWVPFHVGQPSHILPAIENSWNAPASFSFQPGTALGGAYKDHFLLGCKGNIRAFKMVADGAGFKREGDHVPIQGLGWQVLTSTFAPDGRLFFTLWKPRGNRSQLWALQGKEETTEMAEVKALLAKGFSSYQADQLISFLGHADRRIRLQSQFELARRKEGKALRAKAIDAKADLLPRLHALWGLGQLKARDRDLLKLLCQDKHAEVRAQAVRWAGDLSFDPDNLVPGLLRDPSPRVRLMAGIACGKLKSKDALEPLTELIVGAANKKTVLRHAGIYGLAGAVTPSELKGLSQHDAEALRIAAVVALRRQRAFEELAVFLEDPSPQVMSDAARALYDEASEETFTDHPNLLSALANCLHPSRPTPVNVRAIAANRRLGTIEAARRLVAFLVTPKLDPALRVEALYSLESWPDASTLDPMDGRHFPVSQGDPDALGEVVGPEVWSLANDSNDKVSRRVIALLRKIEPSSVQLDRVVGYVLDEKQRSPVRIEWLRWLRKWKIDLFSSVGVQALASKSVELRVVASQELIGAKRGREEVAEYVMGVLKKSSDSSELQQAIKMVQRLPARNAIVSRLADELFAGSIAPPVQLEVFEVAKALAKQDKALQAKLENHQAKTAEKGIMATYGMSLVGGNVEKGRRVFHGHAQAQCAKCHALKQTDKQVGPSLEGIAKRHSREYLLRSIVDPQADLVSGYAIITLQLNDGQAIAGNLISRDPQSITVKLPDGSIKAIALSQVKSESKPIGTMPDVSSFLSLRQVRDLVAYLATLQ